MKKSVVLTGGGIILGLALVAGGLWYWNFRRTHGPQSPGFIPKEAVDECRAKAINEETQPKEARAPC